MKDFGGTLQVKFAINELIFKHHDYPINRLFIRIPNKQNSW
jgi:hypothetical protein